MKKSNIILALVLAAASVFLLWLWFYLGFNMVDNPIDLTVSIVWWLVIIAAIALIVRAEKKRQQAIRTVFIGEKEAFNPELGTIEFDGDAVDEVEGALKKLEYGFKKQDLSEDAAKTYSAVVKSPVFKVREADGEKNGAEKIDWQGEVIFTATGESASFSTKEELEKILAA